MLLHRTLTIFLALLLSTALMAQSKKNTGKAKKLMAGAAKMLEQPVPNYGEVLKIYLEAITLDAENPILNYQTGVCYLNTPNKKKAIPFLEKALTGGPEIPAEVHYLLGKAYHQNYEFEKAIEQFGKYRLLLSESDLREKAMPRHVAMVVSEGRPKQQSQSIPVKNLDKIISKRIEECNIASQMVSNPTEAKVENIGVPVNSTYPDYAPVISADETVMYFTSRREGTTGGGRDPIDTKYYEDVYVSYYVNEQWTPPLNIGPPMNTNDHEAAKALSADGQRLFVYKDVNHDGGDLYECRLDGEKWSAPKPLPSGINTSYAEKSICLSADEQLLFFVSDRAGGQGGRDIYMARKNGDGWDKPVNPGPAINTEYDDDGVFFHPDGKTFYFSSKGHNSMGGYDIFKTTYENDQWSLPENMGYPINTPDDDIYFVVSASGEHGYYASEREDGLGDKDIYRIIMKEKKPKLFLLKGTVTDADTHEPLESSIQLVDNSKNKVIAEFKSNSKTGKYLVTLPSGRNYGLSVSKTGYLFHSENFDIPPTFEEYKEMVKDIELHKIAVGSRIILKNIFFDFDKATLRDESINELERLVKVLTDYPNISIEIAGHTDNKGNAEYNKKLSESRAQAVVAYLINKGIAKERLRAAGYGASRAIAPNKNADGSDNPDGRQLNRRTEFEIIKN